MDQASIRKLMLLVAVATAELGSVSQVSACCLTDWLFRRRTQTPTVAYYAAAPSPPVTPGASCGPGYCEETVVRYVPQVAYRTVWQPVPVTTYRRTVNYNPSTGLPITCTQPCTTYTYQARRVPYTTFRPVYTTVPVSSPATAVAPVAAPSSFTAVPAPSSCNACTTPSASVYESYPSTSSPYYSTTPDATSSTPPGATPWQPVEPTPTPQGSNGWPPAYEGSGATPDPADQKPRIDPEANGSFSSLRPPPATAPRRIGYLTDGNPSLTGVPGQTRGYPPTTSNSPASSAMSNTPSSGSSTVPYDVRPLPNVDRRSEGANRQTAPLLNPTRDRTAWVRPIPTRWASSPISWPERQVQHTVKPDNQRAQPPIQQTNGRRLDTRRIPTQQRFNSDSDSYSPSWDQSGWRSARR